ncbi:hypothetical protein [Methylocystis parvus]|uniref:Uncharacterized protein n=1 Tax=Methylocystis parvus TaxID=134 RepID=A0A6B8M9F1_9HYPH|nr:hypothetical protein [Methylocystis parvus]QGM97350.1 hypothetical protein F7D14_07600 [Methylocystis parvus]WBJ98739.1 hypothetical protein MMG94_12015 [Methylocystis parvus OBBP]
MGKPFESLERRLWGRNPFICAKPKRNQPEARRLASGGRRFTMEIFNSVTLLRLIMTRKTAWVNPLFTLFGNDGALTDRPGMAA